MIDGHEFEVILAALLALSELLALSPLKSNSLFQLIKNILGSIKIAKDDLEEKEKKEE